MLLAVILVVWILRLPSVALGRANPLDLPHEHLLSDTPKGWVIRDSIHARMQNLVTPTLLTANTWVSPHFGPGNFFWQNNYEPTISCQYEQRLHGKWLCNPSRLRARPVVVFVGEPPLVPLLNYFHSRNALVHWVAFDKISTTLEPSLKVDSISFLAGGTTMQDAWAQIGLIIDVLIVDLLGQEAVMLPQLFTKNNVDFQDIRQVLIHIHISKNSTAQGWSTLLDLIIHDRAYRMFHKEFNTEQPISTVELGFVAQSQRSIVYPHLCTQDTVLFSSIHICVRVMGADPTVACGDVTCVRDVVAGWVLRAQLVEDQAAVLPTAPVGPSEAEDGANFFYRHFDPTFSCEYEERIGKRGDGGKWICNPSLLETPLVYSVGSSNEYSFEQSINSYFGGRAQIFTFDGYGDITWKPPEVTHFYPYAVGPEDRVLQNAKDLVMRADTTYASVIVRTLMSIAAELNHTARPIDILKVDIEGNECGAFIGMLERGQWPDVHQLLIELHMVPGAPTTRACLYDLVRLLREVGHLHVFHKEPNVMYAQGRAIELSMVKLPCLSIESSR
jgi:hypothetical protein